MWRGEPGPCSPRGVPLEKWRMGLPFPKGLTADQDLHSPWLYILIFRPAKMSPVLWVTPSFMFA